MPGEVNSFAWVWDRRASDYVGALGLQFMADSPWAATAAREASLPSHNWKKRTRWPRCQGGVMLRDPGGRSDWAASADGHPTPSHLPKTSILRFSDGSLITREQEVPGTGTNSV